jgi:nitrogen regulatory protein PII
MVLVVIDDPGKVDDVLEKFEEGGITGATLIESTGLQRKRKKHIPLRYFYANPVQGETDNLTLLTIVPDRETADRCRQIVEGVVGDLDEPNTGVFAAWQLDLVKGITLNSKEKAQE